MATVQEIREAIAAALTGIGGLRVYATIPGQIVAPAVVVRRRSTTFDTSTESDDTTFAVSIFVQFGNDRTAANALDAYLAGSGSSSIRAAIEDDQTLGGVVDWATCVSAEQDSLVEYAGTQYLSADIVVSVG